MLTIHAGQGGTALHSQKFHLLPADLRKPPSETLEPLLFPQDKPPLLDPAFPTLLLCECILVYISPEESSRLLRWFVEKSQNAQGGVLGCIVYEMFGLNDGFGRVMVNNLKVRSFPPPHLPSQSHSTYLRNEGLPYLAQRRIQPYKVCRTVSFRLVSRQLEL